MSVFLEILELAGIGLVTLLPLTNPLSTVAVFLSLSAELSPKERTKQIKLTCIYVFCIMMVAFYGGQLIMNFFGISIPGLRIAGGMIVSLIGFRMLFPQPATPKIAQKQEPEIIGAEPEANFAFVPLAMPITAGPGTIAMIISNAASVKSGLFSITSPISAQIAPVITFLLLTVILAFCLRSSTTLMQKIGTRGLDAITRIMGFLLICMGTQFIINGIVEIVQKGAYS